MDGNNKSCNKKSIISKIEDRLKLRLNATPKFTAMVTGHGNIKAYLHKYKIMDDPSCPCRKDLQTVQHIIFDCPLVEKVRVKLKAVVTRPENCSVSCHNLGVQYHKKFKEYVHNISWNEEQRKSSQ